jgi:NTF2-related export protein 1/2
MPPTTDSDGKTLPILVFNGNVIPDPPSMQVMFEKEMPSTTYEVQAFDSQVLNPNYNAAGPGPYSPESGKNMSILISVSGWVRFGDSKEAPIRGFSESFVLVPNSGATAAKSKGSSRNWLIQSQTFRLVV